MAWDWNRAVPMWDWHQLCVDGWPGWDRDPRNPERPAGVDLTHIRGQGRQSRDIAIEFDDVATGAFYYRDFTPDSLPVVADGGVYASAFWFARLADRDEFRRRYCGVRAE